MPEVHAVTGPFSYTGKYIARCLSHQGVEIRGLVQQPQRVAGFDCRRLQFSEPDQIDGGS